MNSIEFSFLHRQIADWRRLVFKGLCLLICLLIVGIQPAFAGINDDVYDGNMFVVYAGNGSLVPSRFTLAQSLAEHKPIFLAFYLDDSSDCKQYAIVISRVQEFYGKAAEIIPISVDTISSKKTYEPTEPGYYYSGGVPQVVVFNQSGEVVLNKQGQVPFEEIDDRLREVFDLLPRTESVQLKRRSFNEFSSELAK
ncbi:conserved hypothetical protein [Trichormus variabilis ATCC 29413]|uniref:Thioredoxin-like fold domain-containing protein n=2 Tax=Anabaena variabilis TaxID=264691 RepID=Q3M553_TRIV2|nr:MULTISPECIES: thylakoid membrane photosystem I accumulation factor [Nostocaceae]ABA23883.1 conserved hypothetical protein [Trichormus variabilis ATCC 29413]MBC1214857.1 thylakoid membrane photosystem I accumulation factor [Trichormus variabilis ARAD]MBC1256156.1 thylakoid membrane photosystem I accumulation factor [Trichormus variabilis V5]MBC1266867.1 thylakoid membrane photosystem I accumulation factor [Trichormus variabilis FSR]MBC1300455.1 thylakoid membrane photosystem I accumulation f